MTYRPPTNQDIIGYLTAILGGYSASECAIARGEQKWPKVHEGLVIDRFILTLAYLPPVQLASLAVAAEARFKTSLEDPL
jgi:hypothetical protein